MPHANRLSAKRHAVAIAALTFDLTAASPAADGAPGLMTIQVLPAGTFAPSDGRPMDSPPWNLDATAAAAVIARFNAVNPRQPAVIDYEHQTLYKEKNGQPAPAAGWFRSLSWRDGQGLFSQVEMTARARAAIDAKEYLYFSPVFTYDRATGTVTSLRMGAITNDPGIHGIPPLSTVAAATAAFLTSEENPVNPLLAALIKALGLPDTTTEEEAIAALNKLPTAAKQAEAACSALQLGADASPDAIAASVASLRTSAAPDPTKYVPVEAVKPLQESLAALTARQREADVDARIKPALADGRLLPAQEGWARSLGQKDLSALDGYLSTAQPLAALTATQTNGKPPAGAGTATGAAQLSKDELAVCTAMGLTPDQYKAAAQASA